MSTITLAEVRNHVESCLVDDALQQHIDTAESEILSTIGSVDEQIDDIVNDYPFPKIVFLTRKADSIDEIVEQIGDTETTLDSNDYRLRHGGLAVERLATGVNPGSRWGEYVTITYTPIDDTAARKMVIVDLVKLSLEYNGLKSNSIGPYSSTQKDDYQAERSRIISRLITNLVE